MMRFAAMLIGVGLLATACGKAEVDTNGDSAAGAAEPAAEKTTTDVTGAILGAGSDMRVVLTGGPKPGSYDKKSDDPTCTVGWASQGAWGNAASDLEDKSGLIGIDLIVPRPAAAKSGTNDFMMIVYLDDRMDPKNQFVLEPTKGKGSGTVTIDDRGKTAKVTVRGKTAEGVGVEATIDCGSVLRA